MVMSTQNLDSRLVSFTNPASFAAEQYQGLRLTIERMSRTNGAQVIAVTSPAAGEGKTLTSINLAGALAREAEGRVLLIDADLRRPSVARSLGLGDGDTNGLADIIADPNGQLAAAARGIGSFNLSVVPAGTPGPAIHKVLRSPRLEQVLQEARKQFDVIVIDTPPLLPVFDSALLSRLVDGLLIVVAANQTPRKLLGEALNLVDPAKVLGIVFNRDDRPMFGYYDEYYREYFPETSGVASQA
jgi:capsular exopolysaccharide synthesis family protein